MNKKSHKKKKKRGRQDDGRNKENVEVEVENENDVSTNEEVDDAKKVCYEMKTSDVMGRYLVASREILPGEVILSAPALVVGPCSGCAVVCLGCYRELQPESLYKCKGCKWPLCSPSCFGLGKYVGHSKYECDTLKHIPPDYSDMDEFRECYHALTPLRCLLLKKEDPEKWSAISRMEAHNVMRKSRADIWPVNQRYVVDRIKSWGLDYDEEEIHTVCGILEVNAFEVGGAAVSARALYDNIFLVAHSCVPSTSHTDAERSHTRTLTLRAATKHSPGDLISLCYTYTLQGTQKRREHIMQSKFFWCSCVRCSDPAELGTLTSAFCCPRCAAPLLSVAPLSQSAAWRCAQCKYELKSAAAELLMNRLTGELERVDASDVDGFEQFLHKYRNVLHDSHYLCLSAKHSLSQLYGKVEDHMIQEMPASELQRKVSICRELMQVFDVIEPGYSRLRGVTLYELHAPLMILTTREFEKKAITKDNLKTRLKEIVGYLTEAALILGFEPQQSSEGLMAAAAREALTKIKTWEGYIGKIS